MATEQSSSAFYTLTSVIEVKDIGDGKFELSEVQADEAPLPDLHSGNRKTFDYGLPVPGLKIVAYVDIGDKEIGAYLTFGGTQVGPKYTASVDKGIELSLNLKIAKGSVRLYKKDKDIRVHFDLTVGVKPFSKHFSDDVKVFQI